MSHYHQRIYAAIIFSSLILFFQMSSAQTTPILERKVTVNCNHCPVKSLFTQMEQAAAFTFSYQSNIIPAESAITITMEDCSVKAILKTLFQDRYQFVESNNFLVITLQPKNLKIITTDISTDQQNYSISGLIVDEKSDERLMNVSVYEKQLLQATLTDEHGYFKLKFRNGNPQAITVTASKLDYADANVNFLQTLAVSNRKNTAAYTEAAQSSRGIEKEGLGRFMIGARQKIQSLNIPDFFAKRPFQISVTPGLSTHGLMSSQVVNKFSVNLAGGYTAGVKCFEIGGIFNINRFNSKYFQLAGIFNLVGGTVTGLQIAGISNKTLNSVKGVQTAAFLNKAEGTVSGVQLAALSNESHILKGLQIGLVNKADTSYGASLGLINFIGNGFYKIGLSANDLINTNLSFTTGTHNFYTTVHAGTSVADSDRKYALGLSIGHDFMFSERFFLSAIGDYQLYGIKNFKQNWKQLKMLMNVQLNKNMSVYAGPTFRQYSLQRYNTTAQPDAAGNYIYTIANTQHKNKFAWEAGIAFNSAFKPLQKATGNSDKWYMGLSGIAGYEVSNARKLSGGSIFLMREFNDHFAATLSAGFINQVSKSYLMRYVDYGKTYTGIDQKRFQAIPIKAGIRTYSGKNLFFSGELGYLAGLNNPNYTSSFNAARVLERTYFGNTPKTLIAAAGIGYTIGSGLETSINYDNYLGQSMNSFSFNLAYKFKLSRN